MGADKTEEVMGESRVFTPDEGTGVIENDTGKEKEEHSHENMGAHDDMEESIPESPKKYRQPRILVSVRLFQLHRQFHGTCDKKGKVRFPQR